ncbi:hypothetical protein [Rhodococcoides fascians]|uniref:hypothetical protein n=1 Tax=Rhodococcoides fascians TaxID=1828 RepID=UPI0005655D08|nr:hypothetical protein [Rhodococcus fascians]
MWLHIVYRDDTPDEIIKDPRVNDAERNEDHVTAWDKDRNVIHERTNVLTLSRTANPAAGE